MVRGTVGQSVVDVLEGHMDTLGEEGERPPEKPGERRAHAHARPLHSGGQHLPLRALCSLVLRAGD